MPRGAARGRLPHTEEPHTRLQFPRRPHETGSRTSARPIFLGRPLLDTIRDVSVMSDPCEFSSERLFVAYDREFSALASEIDRVAEAVMAIVGRMDCAGGREHDIELALREALANAIKHGCKNDPSKLVRCTVACDPEQGMLVVVRDSGEGFDPGTIPSPLIGDNVFRHHGRGIYLISRLMDEVRFEKGGTEIHMRARGPVTPSPDSTS